MGRVGEGGKGREKVKEADWRRKRNRK